MIEQTHKVDMDCCSPWMRDNAATGGRVSERRAAKRVPRKRLAVKEDEAPQIFRAGSVYQVVFSLLFKYRHTGVTRDQLVKEVMAITKRPERLCRYDVSIVTSPSEDGTAHRSANRAANSYFVSKMPGCEFLQLHMRQPVIV